MSLINRMLYESVEAYIRNSDENGLNYTWFSTESLHFGMAKKKVSYYNSMCKAGEMVKLLFATRLRYSNVILTIRKEKNDRKVFQYIEK